MFKLALALALVVAAVCAADFEITLIDNAFVPNNITITCGDSVIFVANTTTNHNVFIDDCFDCLNGTVRLVPYDFPENMTQTAVFTGEACVDTPIYCSYHSTMIGEIYVVQPTPSPSSAATASPSAPASPSTAPTSSSSPSASISATPSPSAPGCAIPDVTCQRDCITIEPSKVPNPSKVPKPSKQPAASKFVEPEYYTVEVTFPCDSLPNIDCCGFYDALPDGSSAKWQLCGDDSAESRRPTYDANSGVCSIYMYAMEGGALGITDAEFQAAQDSVVAALCASNAADCKVSAKDSQSLASIYVGSSSSLVASVALLVAAVLAALL